jgi:hypothetical protein
MPERSSMRSSTASRRPQACDVDSVQGDRSIWPDAGIAPSDAMEHFARC